MQQESALYAPPRVLLRAEQVAERLAIGKSTWDKWVAGGDVKAGATVGNMRFWDSRYIESVMDEILSGAFPASERRMAS